MKMNDTTTEIAAMQTEAVRYAELHREDLDLSNEYDAAICVIWFLLNPAGVENRNSVGTSASCDIYLPPEKTKALKFTAHAHHREPQKESPDDKLLFADLNRYSRTFMHFIVDRFKIRRVR